jgi:hypothetical protein
VAVATDARWENYSGQTYSVGEYHFVLRAGPVPEALAPVRLVDLQADLSQAGEGWGSGRGAGADTLPPKAVDSVVTEQLRRFDDGCSLRSNAAKYRERSYPWIG